MNDWPQVTQNEEARRAPGAWTRRKKWGRLAFLIIAVALVVLLPAILVSLLGPSWRPWRQGDTIASTEVQISSLEASLSPGDSAPSMVRVEIQLKNNTERAQLVDAWWFLAQPGDREPWLRYRYQSTLREDVFLEPKSTVGLIWEEELAVMAGEYELSAWVHSGPEKEEKHADGVFLDQRLKLSATGLPYLRRNGPADLEIESVPDSAFQHLSGQAPMGIRLPITVRNASGRDLIGDVTWDLVHASEEQPFEPNPALRGGILTNQTFVAGQETTVNFYGRISPRPGAYLLLVRVAVHARQDETWDDQKLFTKRLEVTDNKASDGIARMAQPTGDVSIASLAVDESVIHRRSPLSLRLSLDSISSAAEEVRAWWFLSSPGVNEPWLDNDFASHEVEASVDPGATQELEISDVVDVAPGTYELSVWLHVVSGDRDEPSDGVWFARRVEVR